MYFLLLLFIYLIYKPKLTHFPALKYAFLNTSWLEFSRAQWISHLFSDKLSSHKEEISY